MILLVRADIGTTHPAMYRSDGTAPKAVNLPAKERFRPLLFVMEFLYLIFVCEFPSRLTFRLISSEVSNRGWYQPEPVVLLAVSFDFLNNSALNFLFLLSYIMHPDDWQWQQPIPHCGIRNNVHTANIYWNFFSVRAVPLYRLSFLNHWKSSGNVMVANVPAFL